MTPAFVLLLSTCDLGDHACRAKDYVARAHEQGIAHDLKVQRLYLAHVEHLSDFDVRRDARSLCDARKVLSAARAARPTPKNFIARLQNAAAEAALRERTVSMPCERTPERAPRPAPPELARAEGPVPSPDPLDSELLDVVSPAPPERPAVQTPASETRGLASSVSPRGAADAPGPAPQGAASAPEWQGVPPARPGRRLMIAGSVPLALGLVATGLAAYTGSRTLATLRAGEALAASAGQGARDEQLAQDAALRRDFERMGDATVGLAVAGGASLVVSAVLVGVGGRRLARAASRAALVPSLNGLTFLRHF